MTVNVYFKHYKMNKLCHFLYNLSLCNSFQSWNPKVTRMELTVQEDSFISDSEAFAFVVEALDNVAAAPSEISSTHRDQYAEIVNILDPYGKSPRDDALLVTTLKALTGAVSKINIVYHASLLRNIFSICLWDYELDTRKVIFELIITLAAVPDKYLDGCLQMLVANFVPPRRIRERHADKLDICHELNLALHDIAYLVPRAPLMLREVIDQNMPRVTDPKEVINFFVKCMLELKNCELGEIIGSMLLTKVVELLVDMDVNIQWEDILKEDYKSVFELELEDGDENAYSTNSLEKGLLKDNAIAEKLDSLMVIVCEYLHVCALNGCLEKVFEILIEAFCRTVMNAYKSKFAQFVMFYACSLDPKNCGEKFALMLRDIFVSNPGDQISRFINPRDQMSRMSSISYLASFLVRANFIPTSLVAEILQSLVDWCSDYCKKDQLEGMVYLKLHRVFYSGCQAVMYILCFHMRSLLDACIISPLLKLEPILCSALNPLKICLPIIVKEFLRQSKAGNLFQTATTCIDEELLESEFSKAFGGVERLDMFFPFDPYLLKESDRFIRPNFNFWSMEKTKYNDPNSDSEDEELDAPEDEQLIEGHNDFDNISGKSDDCEDDDDIEIELSLDKMSITPKLSNFHFPLENKFSNGMQMPARIRPSVSP